MGWQQCLFSKSLLRLRGRFFTINGNFYSSISIRERTGYLGLFLSLVLGSHVRAPKWLTFLLRIRDTKSVCSCWLHRALKKEPLRNPPLSWNCCVTRNHRREDHGGRTRVPALCLLWTVPVVVRRVHRNLLRKLDSAGRTAFGGWPREPCVPQICILFTDVFVYFWVWNLTCCFTWSFTVFLLT